MILVVKSMDQLYSKEMGLYLVSPWKSDMKIIIPSFFSWTLASSTKRQHSTSDDELPANKKPFFHPDSDNTGVILVTTHKNPAVKGAGSPPPEDSVYRSISSTHPHAVSAQLNNPVIFNSSSSPPELISVPAKNNQVQLVRLNSPPQLSCPDVNASFVQSPHSCGKSSEISSSDDSDDSDAESPVGHLAGGSTTKSFLLNSSNPPKIQNSLIPSTHFLHLGQHQTTAATTTAPQIVPSSAIQPVISYQQPLFIQPSLDGRTQQILVPIATVPLAGNNTNKISTGGPQGLYLQTCPIVQGTNSSQTLQVATIPNCDTTNQSQQLLHSSLPIYINGHSTQLPSHSSQPIQIVTLTNATPHVVHS